MEFHQLETFEAVVLHGSFTRAADVLFLTQPAVTRQIASLEAELHTRLFDRLGRSIRLTPAGETLHRYATQILRLMREARDAVSDVEQGGGGRLEVGASSTLATYALPPLLRRFREQFPTVELSITTGVSGRILEQVREGDVDVALVTTEAQSDRSQLIVRILADYETCVVVPPAHTLADRETVSPTDLSHEPLILMEPGTSLRHYADTLFAAANFVPQIVMELDNVEAIKRMIEAELGISLLPRVAVETEVTACRLTALSLTGTATDPTHKTFERKIALVYHQDKHLTTALRAFLTLAKDEQHTR